MRICATKSITVDSDANVITPICSRPSLGLPLTFLIEILAAFRWDAAGITVFNVPVEAPSSPR